MELSTYELSAEPATAVAADPRSTSIAAEVDAADVSFLPPLSEQSPFPVEQELNEDRQKECQQVPKSALSAASISDRPCLWLRGLPFEAQADDVADFFDGFGVHRDDVILLRRKSGRPSGIAKVSFVRQELADRALNTMHLKKMSIGPHMKNSTRSSGGQRHRYIEVFSSPPELWASKSMSGGVTPCAQNYFGATAAASLLLQHTRLEAGAGGYDSYSLAAASVAAGMAATMYTNYASYAGPGPGAASERAHAATVYAQRCWQMQNAFDQAAVDPAAKELQLRMDGVPTSAAVRSWTHGDHTKLIQQWKHEYKEHRLSEQANTLAGQHPPYPGPEEIYGFSSPRLGEKGCAKGENGRLVWQI